MKIILEAAYTHFLQTFYLIRHRKNANLLMDNLGRIGLVMLFILGMAILFVVLSTRGNQQLENNIDMSFFA